MSLCVPCQFCPTLFQPMDCGPPGFSVRGIIQAGILEWVAISYSRGSSRPMDQTHVSSVSCIGRQVFITSATWEAHLCNGASIKTSNELWRASRLATMWRRREGSVTSEKPWKALSPCLAPFLSSV